MFFFLVDLDSGGNLHGPLDLKHSSKVDGVRKTSGSYIKKSWVEGQRSQSSTRSEGEFPVTRSFTHHSYSMRHSNSLVKSNYFCRHQYHYYYYYLWGLSRQITN